MHLCCEMQYPLTLQFKFISVSTRLKLIDAAGQLISLSKKKKFRFKEHVEVYQDEKQTQLLANIHADKVIDWSARYNFTDANETLTLGAVGRKGMRSMWKATYEVFGPQGDQVTYTIEEENPFAKFLDAFLGEIPVLGIIATLLINPKYVVKRAGSEELVLRLTKKPAFFEGKFTIDKLADIPADEEFALLMSLQMVTLLERARG